MMEDLYKKLSEIGELQPLSPGGRFLLFGSNSIWYVHSGAVDVFLTKNNLTIYENTGDETNLDSLHHSFRIDEGQIYPGTDEPLENKWYLLARVCSKAVIFKIKLDCLAGLKSELTVLLAKKIDELIFKLARSNIQQPFPKLYLDAYSLNEAKIVPNQNIFSSKGVLWFQLSGECWFIGDSGFLVSEKANYSAISPFSWFQILSETQLLFISTLDLLKSENGWFSIREYIKLILKLQLIYIDNAYLYNNVLLYEKIKYNQAAIIESITNLKSAYELPRIQLFISTIELNFLYTACSYIANYLGVNLKFNSEELNKTGNISNLKKIMTSSNLFFREIYLRRNWYEFDHGPLLVFKKNDNQPIALIPKNDKQYLIYEKADSIGECLTEGKAKLLKDIAYSICPGSGVKCFSFMALMRASTSKFSSKVLKILFYYSLTTFFALLVPILSQFLFNDVIMMNDKSQLFEIAIIFLVTTISISIFDLTKHYVLLNIETKFDCNVHSIFWDRILKLPVGFFKEFTTGELVSRISNLFEIRLSASNGLVRIFLDGLFSIASIFLLFYYQLYLALFVTFFISFYLFSSYFIIKKTVAYENEIVLGDTKIFALLGEILLGITKIRLCGAEYRAFLNWSREFSLIQGFVRKNQKVMVLFNSFISAMPLLILCSMYIGLGIFYQEGYYLSTGNFMAFNIALGQVILTLYSMIKEVEKIVKVYSLYSKTKIFIESVPEVATGAKDPGELLGEVEINHVSFKHPNTENIILKEININIKQGEYIALVGKSGAGKSTLLRLLLGFERPTTGRIYFDNKDMSDLDVSLLRKHIGVVLQHDDLTPGNIFSNISGVCDLTIDEAWAVAEKCDIAKDILAMPMQMNTMISMGGSGLSGGQKQRLLLARAIAGNPKILILDEATRALDNVTQRNVVENLSKMKITKIVVAHRLSTLMRVDKIFVLDEGVIAEVGTYDELIRKKGAFYQFTKKQNLSY